MTDQQRLRDALRAAVPEPPTELHVARAARRRAARTRRTRGVVAVGLAVVAAVGGVALWAGHRAEQKPPVSGSGEAACRQLARTERGGSYVDSRVVDGTTASAWLAKVAPHIDASAYRDDARVTACLTSVGNVTYLRVVGTSGRPVEVVRGGFHPAKYGGLTGDMTLLDSLWKGGAATTDAPFSCDGPPTERYPDVTTSVPDGATAARICFDGGYFTPPQVLTRGIASLIRDVNASPLEYSPPTVNCSGAGEPDFTIVFRYRSGTRSVSEETCRGLALGQYTRSAAVTLEHTFMSQLVQQVGVTPGSDPAPSCPRSPSARPEGVGDLRNVVAARYCPGSARGDRSLGRAQLALLRTWGRSLEYGATTQPDHVCPRPTTGWPRLSLEDAWGDHFTVVLIGCPRRIFPAAVDWGAPDRVIYPLGDMHAIARLARQLVHAP